MLDQRSEPGTYMAPELVTGAMAEPLPLQVITRFRDALQSIDNSRNTQGDR